MSESVKIAMSHNVRICVNVIPHVFDLGKDARRNIY